jgi:hypothetical protein
VRFQGREIPIEQEDYHEIETFRHGPASLAAAFVMTITPAESEWAQTHKVLYSFTGGNGRKQARTGNKDSVQPLDPKVLHADLNLRLFEPVAPLSAAKL